MKIWSSCRNVSAAEEMNPDCRETMEDVYRAIDGFNNEPTTGYFAVYDGHGGREIVDFITLRLEKAIAKEITMSGDATMDERLARAFICTDIMSSKVVSTPSGATAVTCIVRQEGSNRVLHTANVGDSRAVLCDNEQAIRLTYDHKAEDTAEAQRIESAGGVILRDRVLGILAVTRSFGDHGLKEYVSARPYTSTTVLKSSKENPFVILACDGIWDVITDAEAVALVLEAMKNNQQDRAANLLVNRALDLESTDNITVVVVFL